jgi:hypothetical protein
MAVREHEIRVLRERLTSGEALEGILDAHYPYVLDQLVFDPGDHNPTSAGDLLAWSWLGSVLTDSLRRGSTIVAIGVASMIATRESGSRREPWTVDPSILTAFFPDNAAEVIDRLGQLADAIAEQGQRQSVTAIAESGKTVLAARNSTSGST